MKTGEKRERFMRLKTGDVFLYLFLVLLLGVILFLQFIVFAKEGGDVVCITCNGEKQIYSLTDDRTVTVAQNGITLTVEITNGSVCVSHADCPDRICVRTGSIRKAWQSIVCLPAHCEITIEGGEDGTESGVDGIVG